MIKTVGSVCSGIEAASVAWNPLGFQFQWFSEIAAFPSLLLKEKFPDVINVGDMKGIPDAIESGKIFAPDLICGGTPCQAFSLAGLQNGLKDDRGNLTLKFVDIIEANDKIREKNGQDRSIVLWENVEGVLKDKTNAFGCLVSSLAGLDNILVMKKWPNAGVVQGKKRNVAWRVLDAKFFGVPQQRRRLYVIAGGKEFLPENVLFEMHEKDFIEYPNFEMKFSKNGHEFEIFREYTDCLYSAYGTKWNGNAAAYNGSLFVVQNGRLRRFSPLECERLMGFPDNYTDIKGNARTNRYQAIGNSWVVPVIRWIGERIKSVSTNRISILDSISYMDECVIHISKSERFINLGKDLIYSKCGKVLNCTEIPENCCFKSLKDIISSDVPEAIYISPVGCYGIIRRKKERRLTINSRLEKVLWSMASQMSLEEIEMKSRIQQRGKYSE